MPAEKTPMRKIREVLRLKWGAFKQTARKFHRFNRTCFDKIPHGFWY